MSCKKCRHWFVNPNIVIPGEPTEGKCLVSEIKAQSNHICNAWERSARAAWADENEILTARNVKLEGFINELIEAGYAMMNSMIGWSTYEELTPEADTFCKLAKDWKEG